MSENREAAPLSNEEIAEIAVLESEDWSPTIARLLATIRERDARLERIRVTPCTVAPAVLPGTGQLALTILTPQDPRGEMVALSKNLSLQIAGAILQAQGFVPVQVGANAAGVAEETEGRESPSTPADPGAAG